MTKALTLTGLAGIAAAMLALSACDNPPADEGLEPIGPEVAEPEVPMQPEPVEPPAEAEMPVQPPPTLPTDDRTSEESVRPDSDTMFY
ncbi:hypothetical protein [Brevundimonas poindexterae]|uniref:hypothetical protein n=1 Tax=Brevundimonas poindexterae TaxID=74325 RepID=UPI001CFDCE13|nr:hypothetical protein [Brevundimonas poindexterae]